MNTKRKSPKLSWQLPEKMWQLMKSLVKSPKNREGRPKNVEEKRVLSGIFYVLRTGIQWQALPRERFGPPSTVYYYFKKWAANNVFEKLWQKALAVYNKTKGLDWNWQSIDGAMTKAPLAGEATGPNPTDRGKKGTKRSLLTDGRGIPIAVVVAEANRNDMKLLAKTLDAIVIEHTITKKKTRKHLCADRGYDYRECRSLARNRGYILHIPKKRKKEATTPLSGYKARRWVVEVTHSWLNRFRKILIRFEKNLNTHLAMLQLACTYIVLKRASSF